MKGVACPYCQSPAKLVDSSVVYGRSYGNIWLCSNYPICDAYVGVHKATNEPLGRLADRELREWKKRAHAAFDPLWKSGRYRRKDAYYLLSQALGIRYGEAHIGEFDIELCKRTIEAVRVIEASPP